MKVVIDTNVFVASFLNASGKPRRIIDLWKTGEITLCLCAEILQEYVEVLLRFGLEGEPEMGELLELFRQKVNMIHVPIDPDIKVVSADPDDDKFIACALAANADCIISGDSHLLELKRHKTVSLLTPSEFMDLRQVIGKMKRVKG